MTATSSSSGHREEYGYEECNADVMIGLLSSLDVYLPMLLLVSCGKNDFAHFAASQ
jgi:hypothetical protein